MGDNHLDIRSGKVYGRIEGLFGHAFIDQVQQTVFGDEFGAVELHAQAFVQVGIMPDHFPDKIQVDRIVVEQGRVRLEFNQCPVFLTRLPLAFFQQDTLGEYSETTPPFPEGFYIKPDGSCIYGLKAHPVQSHGFLKGFVIVFGPGIHFIGSLDHFSERDSPAVIPDRDNIVPYGNGDHLSIPHGIFINGVVNDFLDQDI